MVTYAPIALTASKALSIARHGDSALVVNAAAGLTLTLPAAAGTGARFRVFIGTTVTSNNVVIAVANASDVMYGSARVAQDGGDTAVAFETAADSDTITLNGTTKGGIVGDYIELEDIATNKWRVEALLSATGTEASPFSAAVS
jgi:hypothetical protein